MGKKRVNKKNQFIVMQVYTEIEYFNPVLGITESVKLGGCAGYIPVYGSLEEAEAASLGGEYKIVTVKVG